MPSTGLLLPAQGANISNFPDPNWSTPSNITIDSSRNVATCIMASGSTNVQDQAVFLTLNGTSISANQAFGINWSKSLTSEFYPFSYPVLNMWSTSLTASNFLNDTVGLNLIARTTGGALSATLRGFDFDFSSIPANALIIGIGAEINKRAYYDGRTLSTVAEVNYMKLTVTWVYKSHLYTTTSKVFGDGIKNV
jgi:hypothetical protein